MNIAKITATLATCLMFSVPAFAQNFDFGGNQNGLGGKLNVPGMNGGPSFGYGQNGFEFDPWSQGGNGGYGNGGNRYPGGGRPDSGYGPGTGTYTTHTRRGGLPPTATSAVGLNVVEAGSFGGSFYDFGGWNPLGGDISGGILGDYDLGSFPGGGPNIGIGGGGINIGGTIPFPGGGLPGINVGGHIPFP